VGADGVHVVDRDRFSCHRHGASHFRFSTPVPARDKAGANFARLFNSASSSTLLQIRSTTLVMESVSLQWPARCAAEPRLPKSAVAAGRSAAIIGAANMLAETSDLRKASNGCGGS